MDEVERRGLLEKLIELREAMPSLYPPEVQHGYESDLVLEKIHQLTERLGLIFDRFDVPGGKVRLVEAREGFKQDKDKLWIIEDPPWREGQYGVLVTLEEIIDDFLFVYSDKSGSGKPVSRQYQQLLQLLRGFERSLTVSQRYPRDEREFQAMVDAVLICNFPRLTHPKLGTPLKHFAPDTGIPEARTLIEYKYISARGQVNDRVDEIFADLEGYRHRDWERLIYVFYETERLVPEEKWTEQLRHHSSTEAVVVRGIPAVPRGQVRRPPVKP